MNARQRLDDYLASLTQRLRMAAYTRTGAIAAVLLFGLTFGAVVWLAPLGFPTFGVVVTRMILFAALVALGVILWRALRHMREHAGDEFEQRLPDQHGRIQTYLDLKQRESQGTGSPFADLLAEDALAVAKRAPVEEIVSNKRLWIAGGIAAAAVVALVAMMTIGSERWGYGSRYLLLGAKLPEEAVRVREVSLAPGDITLRRNADLKVKANVRGVQPREVELFVRFDGNDAWERASMQPDRSGEHPSEYVLTLYAVRAPMEYYAVADGVKSAQHAIKVVDVPRIETMQLSYAYPEWTGMKPHVEAEERNIRAVADTQVSIAVKASEPLVEPALVIAGAPANMTGVANAGKGELTVSRPSKYYVAAKVAGDMVALTDEYEIDVVNDAPPTIEIVKPGRDWRATNIEEVPVAVRAQDDFRVNKVELRYAVNGGEWRSVKLPSGTQDAQVKTLLQMEELGGNTPLVPGDLVTYYAVTQDRNQKAETDLYMVQVQPFERRFTESQGGGGGGGGDGGSEQQQIAERQREILVATWNLQRASEQKRRTPEQLHESAQLLSGLQDKLAEQTNTLVERTKARTRTDADPRIKQFVESLQNAAKAMAPASAQLSALKLQEAVPNEQQALQMLLRAESAFRDIQVSRQERNQGGGGGANASRDISELYELEMDLSKNKYETEQQLSQEEQKAGDQDLEAALAKLKELAERQEKLAEQARQQPTPTNAERWRQEQLRREAEELRRRLQQLAQQQSSQQSGQQSQSGGASQSQSGQPQSGQQQSNQGGASQQEIQAALNSVEQALQAMRNAENAANNGRRNESAADQASRNLRQAQRNIEPGTNRKSSSDSVGQLAEQAKRAADQQRAIEQEIYKAIGGARDESNSRPRRDGLSQSQAQQLADAKQRLMEEVERIENKLRETAQAQRRESPKTAERLGEIAEELSGMNPQGRLQRGITALERGRADQAAMEEGLVTEALQNTASDLRDAARLASQEAQQRAQAVDPQALLAELAQLRRALENAQRDAQSAQANRAQAGQQGNQQGQQGQQPGQQPGQQSGQQSGQQPGSQSGQPAQSGDSQSQSAQATAGGQAGGADTGARAGAWNGGALTGGPQQRIGDGDGLRYANQIRQQLNTIQNRIATGSISPADLEALRAIIPQIRRLDANALDQQANLLRNLEGVELAALAVADKNRKQAAARAGMPAAGNVQDSDAAAEYYRRLSK